MPSIPLRKISDDRPKLDKSQSLPVEPLYEPVNPPADPPLPVTIETLQTIDHTDEEIPEPEKPGDDIYIYTLHYRRQPHS